jgi:hypothetical protein
VWANAQQQSDVALSCGIKVVVSALPLLARCCCWLWGAAARTAAVFARGGSSPARALPAAACAQPWALSVPHQLAAAAAAALPLCAALVSRQHYHVLRDCQLALVQTLLLVVLQQLVASTPAGAAAAAAAGSASVLPGAAAAVLLLLFRQRVCWAVYQAAADAALLLMLPPGVSGWQGQRIAALQLLPLALVLLVLHVREKVDR